VPAELRIDEAADDELLSAFEAVLVDGFPMEELQPPRPGCVLDGRALDASFHCWVGSVGRKPVAACAAYFTPDVVLVAWVATLPGYRGRGYGAALTWAALREAPRLAAALIASDAGRPVYERLGFLPVARVTCLVMTERRPVRAR
jgi:GNAT superfamily N-acetyltransferase